MRSDARWNGQHLYRITTATAGRVRRSIEAASRLHSPSLRGSHYDIGSTSEAGGLQQASRCVTHKTVSPGKQCRGPLSFGPKSNGAKHLGSHGLRRHQCQLQHGSALPGALARSKTLPLAFRRPYSPTTAPQSKVVVRSSMSHPKTARRAHHRVGPPTWKGFFKLLHAMRSQLCPRDKNL